MRAEDFSHLKTGQLVRTEGSNWAFVPDLLPPGVNLLMSLLMLCSEADAELGRLSGLVDQLGDPESIFMNFMRREAVLSSRIEGTYSTIAKVALVELTDAKAGGRDDKEVANYVEALKLGMKRCQEISLGATFIREIHARLMVGNPHIIAGKEREGQVLVGGDGTFPTARYVPPPHYEISRLMDNLEEFLQDDTLPVLIRAAIAHYQFEAIHPFMDGNGRVGRILISTILGKAGRLRFPVLYLSAYFDAYKLQYYDRLLAVSQKGEWNEWYEYFLIGVRQQARDAALRAAALHKLRDEYRKQVATPRASGTMAILIDELFAIPLVSVPWAARWMRVGRKPAKESINKLVSANILRKAFKYGNIQCYDSPGIDRVLNMPFEELKQQQDEQA